jgi:hypothetical protein
MCNIQALLTQSVIREVEKLPQEDLTDEYVARHLLHIHIMTPLFPPPLKRTSGAQSFQRIDEDSS